MSEFPMRTVRAAAAEGDVRLLHAYGIDCLYWEGGDDFPRLEAPTEAKGLHTRSLGTNLLIRSSMSGHPDPFRSVRDLGSFLALLVHVGPGNRKVVRPSGSQRGSRGTKPGPICRQAAIRDSGKERP